MIKAVLIDDEKNSRMALSKLIESYAKDVHILAEASNLQEGLDAIRIHKPDLVFLDLEMPDSNGLELFEQLDKIDFEVIITTGHQEYAVRAVRTAALDYLLKPIDLEELEQSIERVFAKRKQKKENKNFDIFIKNFKNTSDQQIALASSDGLTFLKVSEIIYCKGDGAYTYFFIEDGTKLTVSKNLKEFEDLLSDKGFFRIHKSYLINLRHMKKYVRGDGGYVVLSNGDHADVSKRKKEGFMKQIAKV